jgi:hypothetical protein
VDLDSPTVALRSSYQPNSIDSSVLLDGVRSSPFMVVTAPGVITDSYLESEQLSYVHIYLQVFDGQNWSMIRSTISYESNTFLVTTISSNLDLGTVPTSSIRFRFLIRPFGESGNVKYFFEHKVSSEEVP